MNAFISIEKCYLVAYINTDCPIVILPESLLSKLAQGRSEERSFTTWHSPFDTKWSLSLRENPVNTLITTKRSLTSTANSLWSEASSKKRKQNAHAYASAHQIATGAAYNLASNMGYQVWAGTLSLSLGIEVFFI